MKSLDFIQRTLRYIVSCMSGLATMTAYEAVRHKLKMVWKSRNNEHSVVGGESCTIRRLVKRRMSLKEYSRT